MPKVLNDQHWEKTFREQVRNLASGWNAVNLTVVPFLVVALGLVIWHNANRERFKVA